MKSELQKQLDNNIPAEAVEQREAWRNGPMLSYLSGAYVINRLNEVLGQGNWGYQIKSLNKVHEGSISQSSGDVFTTSYIATIGFVAMVDGRVASFDEVGYGDGTDKKSAGKAHELATKEAVTDGIKRAAKNLGISLGLGLYFKSGEYINEKESVKEAKETKTTELTKTKETPQQKIEAAKPVVVSRPRDKETNSGDHDSGARPKVDLAVRKKTVESYYTVLKAKNLIDSATFKKQYQAGKKLDELTENEVDLVITGIKRDFKTALNL